MNRQELLKYLKAAALSLLLAVASIFIYEIFFKPKPLIVAPNVVAPQPAPDTGWGAPDFSKQAKPSSEIKSH